jgi:hypothetical protein
MDTVIIRKLRVKRGCQQSALPHQDREAIPFRQNFDSWAHTYDARGANVDHFQWAAGEFRFAGLDRAVDLPAVGIPFHADVQDRQALLGGTGDVFGQENTTGTGTEGGFLLDEVL